MKRLIGMLVCLAAVEAVAVSSREQGMEFLRMFEETVGGDVKTNGSECVRTVVDKQGERLFFYSRESGRLRRVRFEKPEGNVSIYDYREGVLDTAAFSNVRTASGTNAAMTVVHFVGDGKCTNGIDRVEMDYVGHIIVAARMFDVKGNPVAEPPRPSKWRVLDIEYIPEIGSRTRIGPYEWMIVGKDEDGVLIHNGRTLLRGRLAIGGKFPWIVGSVMEPRERANRRELTERGIAPADMERNFKYCFILDVRTDQLELFPVAERASIKERTGIDFYSYAPRGFWVYGKSLAGPKRRAKLEADLNFVKEDGE